MPYPAQPRPTTKPRPGKSKAQAPTPPTEQSTRIHSPRTHGAPPRYDPVTGKLIGSAHLACIEVGESANVCDESDLVGVSFEDDPLSDRELQEAFAIIDRTFQRAVKSQEAELNILNDYVKLSSDIHEAFATRLVQEATPMRELTYEEIEKHKGLVDAARELEYKSFMDEDTFRVIKRHLIPPHPGGKPRKVMSSRELCQWKDYLNKVKIRLVLRGFQDDRRPKLHGSIDSPTLRSDTLRLMLQLGADEDYDCWAWDLKTAFLQGFHYTEEEDLVYWDPPEGFRKFYGITPDEVCVAIKSIYGLGDAPRQWYEKLATKLIAPVMDWLKFEADKGGFGSIRHWLDPCLFMKHGTDPHRGTTTPGEGGIGDPEMMPTFNDIGVAGSRRKPKNVRGNKCTLAAGSHVDDIIAVGTAEELRALDIFLVKQFRVGARQKASEKGGLVYRGQRICKPEPYHFTVDMRDYEIREVKPIKFGKYGVRATQQNKNTTLDDSGQTQYRAANGKLIWLSCNCRPDITTTTSQASSVLGKASEADAIFIDKIVDHVIDNPLTLHYYRLASAEVPRLLRGSGDAAFKRKDERDDRARGGYLLCVGTRADSLIGLINWGSAKIHRVCKSPTGAEAITISGLGDQMDTTYHLLFWFYPEADPCGDILTDAYSVTSSQFKYCSDVSPNLTVDFALIRARVRDGNYKLIHQLGEYMAADGLTKNTNVALKVLLDFLHTNRLGDKGVGMSKIKKGVDSKIQQAFLVGKVTPENITAEYVDQIARVVNMDITGVPEKNSSIWFGKYFPKNEVACLVSTQSHTGKRRKTQKNPQQWTFESQRLANHPTTYPQPRQPQQSHFRDRYRDANQYWLFMRRTEGVRGEGHPPQPSIRRRLTTQSVARQFDEATPRERFYCCTCGGHNATSIHDACDGCPVITRGLIYHHPCQKHAYVAVLGGVRLRFCPHCWRQVKNHLSWPRLDPADAAHRPTLRERGGHIRQTFLRGLDSHEYTDAWRRWGNEHLYD